MHATSSSATSMSSADCGAPRVAADRSTSIGPSSVTSTLLRLSRPCEMPAACRLATWRHRSSHQLVGDLVGLGILERLGVGPAGDEDRVAVGAQRGGHDLWHPHAGLRRHHRRERFVLDLFQPADGGAARRVAVGEQAPAPREPLGVLRVATEHPCADRVPVGVVAHVLRVADAMAPRDDQIAHVHPEGHKAGADALDRRRGRRRAEYEAHQGADRHAEARARPALRTGARPRPRSPRAMPRGISHVANRRTARTSSGPTTTMIAVAAASRTSGKPQRASRCASTGNQSDATTPPSRLPRPTTASTATSTSRASSHRRRATTSTTLTSASTISPTYATRHSPPAHPNTVASAAATDCVLLRRLRRDRRRERDDQRRREQEDRVECPPVAPSGFGRDQQGSAPGTPRVHGSTEPILGARPASTSGRQ